MWTFCPLIHLLQCTHFHQGTGGLGKRGGVILYIYIQRENIDSQRSYQLSISSERDVNKNHHLKMPFVSFTFIHHYVYHKQTLTHQLILENRLTPARVCLLCTVPLQPSFPSSLHCPHPFQCQSTHQNKSMASTVLLLKIISSITAKIHLLF